MTADLAAKVLFGVYALIILAGGVMAVSAKSLVRAMVGLIMTLFGVAGMYLLMNAPFLAMMQVLIYVGAVCVLIFFAIMLTRGDDAGSPGAALPVALG
ncbi:NADH-quinone oxidoreductase subunit J family protein, partial [Salidesulfovibrio brasiliensis]|uniref:NADH-quinone oxidoreductase subunit J family protein n=1 Tax=Salidesulfovibrio brasiliensis TaxID=221711 RepID=UPI00155DA438